MNFYKRIIKDNLKRLLISLIITSLLTYLFLPIINDFSNKTKSQRIFLKSGLSSELIIKFTSGPGFDSYENKKDEIIKSIEGLNGIKHLTAVEADSVIMCDTVTGSFIETQNYNNKYLRDYPFILSEGHLPTIGTNEVVLSYESKDYYKIGDVIQVYVWDQKRTYSSDGELISVTPEYSQPTNLNIVGFLSPESKIYYTTNNTTPISDYNYDAKSIAEDGFILAISYGLTDINGIKVEHKYNYGLGAEYNTYAVDLDEGYKVKSAKDDIYEIVNGYGRILTGWEYAQEEIYKSWDEYRPLIGIILVISFLLIISVISTYIFQIRRGMKAIISYYICGCDWNSIFIHICITNIISTMAGFTLGIVTYKISSLGFSNAFLSTKSYLITICMLIIIQMIISLTFYLSVARLSPIEVRRKENE